MRVQRSDGTNSGPSTARPGTTSSTADFQEVIADPKPDEVEIWEIENESGGWFHPLHIHLIDFKIISRNGRRPFAWERGAKDVFYIGEDETVRVLMRFSQGGGNPQRRRPVHDPLPQPGARGPRHDEPVRGGRLNINDPIASAPCKTDTGEYDDGSPDETSPDGA